MYIAKYLKDICFLEHLYNYVYISLDCSLKFLNSFELLSVLAFFVFDLRFVACYYCLKSIFIWFYVLLHNLIVLGLNLILNRLRQIFTVQKQPSRGVLKQRCSENMQQIYRRTPMPKCYFNKVATVLKSLRHVCSPVNLLHILRTPFPRNTSGQLLLTAYSSYLITPP